MRRDGFGEAGEAAESHLHEADGEVLEDNAVRRRKESEDVLDEVLLVGRELLPVLHIGGKVDLLGCKRGEISRWREGGGRTSKHA